MDDPKFLFDTKAISDELHVRDEVLTRLLKNFSQTLAKNLLMLDAALAVEDIAQARAILHVVKGTAGNLRLDRIYEAAHSMHEAVLAKAPDNRVTTLFKVFKDESMAFIRFAKTL